MRVVLTLVILMALSVSAQAGIFGRRTQQSCYYPQQQQAYYYVPQNIIVEQEIIKSPIRKVRYAEVPGLEIVSDDYRQNLLIVNGRAIDLDSAAFLKEETEVNVKGRIENSTTTEINRFGEKIIIRQSQIKENR